MIISDEQARLAADYLRSHRGQAPCGDPGNPCDVTEDFLVVVRASVERAPDIRPERLEQARIALASSPTSDEVAGKMLGRIVSDSLR